jgi:D-alanine-D-alanine ligase
MTKKLLIGVTMGGISPEHPVSLVSGTGMLRNLDRTKFDAFPILISLDNRWIWPEPALNYELEGFDANKAKEYLESPPNGWNHIKFPNFTKFPHCDLMLIGLHGEGGEDGRLQGFLELFNQPYTGSGSRGSALSMDKITAKQVYQHFNIPTPRYQIIPKSQFNQISLKEIGDSFGYPVVLKNPMGGSSIGLGIARDLNELQTIYNSLITDAERILVEEYLSGREGTCGYLENSTPLPPTEIRPLQDGFFSYEAKYQVGRTEEITPATFPPHIIKEMQRLAAECHKALQLSVYSRTDFIYVGEDSLYVLETNTLPGFTPTSLLPQAAACIGLSYQDLLTKIVEESLKK